jgi:hypothetical protein
MALICTECNHNHSAHSYSSVAVDPDEDGDPRIINHLYVCNNPDCECRHEATGDSAVMKTMLKSLGVAIGG